MECIFGGKPLSANTVPSCCYMIILSRILSEIEGDQNENSWTFNSVSSLQTAMYYIFSDSVNSLNLKKKK